MPVSAAQQLPLFLAGQINKAVLCTILGKCEMCESHFTTLVLWEAFACTLILTIAARKQALRL